MEHEARDDSSDVATLPDTAGVQPEPKQQVPMVATDASPEVRSFYERYRLAMIDWVKQKGNTNFPVVEDPKTGRLRWVNREERRRIRKMRKKK